MKSRLRPLLLALGVIAFGCSSALAQFTALLTESPVTIQGSLTTETITVAGTTRTIATRTPVTQVAFLEDLRSSGIITGDLTGWTLVAVRAGAYDLTEVDGAFFLYAVKGSTRVAVPGAKFSASAYGATKRYTERHQGQYVLSSKGTVTNHVRYAYTPRFTVGGTTYVATEGSSDGFATIQYAAKDFDTDYEVFFYAISSLRVTTLGSFFSPSGEGLYSLTLSLGAARLVPASLYPEVNPFPYLD
jgi:hypothetical protein